MLLTIALVIIPCAFSQECSESASCETCYASSFLCHWCKDISAPNATTTGSCHYKFSQFGCQVGDSCTADDCADRTTCSSCSLGGCKWCASVHRCVSPYSWTCAFPSNCAPNEECQRTQPEFIGYIRGLPTWMLYLLIALYISLITVSVATFYYAYFALVRLTLTTEESAALVSPTDRDRQPASRLWLFRIISVSWTLLLLAIGVLFLLIVLFWPAPPEISMCNAQPMWSDTIKMIVDSVTSGKASVESEILITVYNPNRVSVALNSVSGNISYKGQIVGSVDLGPIDAQPGSAADGLGLVTFNGFDHITEMYYDFNVKHELMLEFELFVSFNVAGLGGFEVPAPKTRLNVNNPPPQKYCKCLETETQDVFDLRDA